MKNRGFQKSVTEDVRKAYDNRPQSNDLFFINNEFFNYSQINTIEKFYNLIRSTCEKGECVLMFGAESRYRHTTTYTVEHYQDDDYTTVLSYHVAPRDTRGNATSGYNTFDTLQHFCYKFYKKGIPYSDR